MPHAGLTTLASVERPNGAAALNRYLNLVGRGRPAGQVFLDAFGISPVEMDRELRQNITRPSFLSLTYELPARVEVDEPDRARTMTLAEAQARLGDVQMRKGRLDEAAVRIEAAAAAAPGEVQPHFSLRLCSGGTRSPSRAIDARRSAGPSFAAAWTRLMSSVP